MPYLQQNVSEVLQTSTNKLLQDLAVASDRQYFYVLSENEKCIKEHTGGERCEKCIDWQAYAAKLYRTSNSISTVTNHCKGLCAFREMLKTKGKTLVQTIDEIKSQSNGLAYKLLDEFVTYCHSQRGFMPRTTNIFFFYVTKFLKFVEIELNDSKIDDITLIRAGDLEDEYPTNEELRKILSCMTLNLHGYISTMCDTGFEPVDAAQLRVRDFHFDEEPARISKKREKTGKKLQGFLSKDTAEIVKQIIANGNKQADDFVFTDNFTPTTVKQLRERYNLALAKAGFGKLVRKKGGSYYAKIVKIEGHKYGKYHLKVYKKRWFSLAMAAGVPEYVAQGMLGRKRYLDQYDRLPLAEKQAFAKKILKVVSVYADKISDEEKRKQAAQILGLGDLSEEQAQKLRQVLFRLLNEPEQANKLLGGQ